MQTQSFSYHIFLFPFKWKKAESENIRLHFSDLVDLKKIDSLILKDERWLFNSYERFNEPEDYNEYSYFYPTVRNVLYDSKENIDKDNLIRHYHFLSNNLQGFTFNIHVNNGKVNKLYELDIGYILLNIYKTGIGIISFHLKYSHENKDYWNDVLTITILEEEFIRLFSIIKAQIILVQMPLKKHRLQIAYQSKVLIKGNT